MVRINFLRTLEMNHRLAATREYFFRESAESHEEQ